MKVPEPRCTRDVAAGAALERRAVDLAGEIDGDAVAVLGLGALALGGERPALLGDLRQRLVDLGLGHLGVQPLELDALEIRKLDRRQDLDRHRVGEIGLALDHLLDRALLVRQRHLRLAHELEAALGDDLGVGLAHRRLDHLGHHRAAIQALEMGDRHLARTEAVDADLVLELGRACASALVARSAAGTTTLNSRLRPSLTVSVTCITTIFVLCRSARRPRFARSSVRSGLPVRCARRGAGGGT